MAIKHDKQKTVIECKQQSD